MTNFYADQTTTKSSTKSRSHHTFLYSLPQSGGLPASLFCLCSWEASSVPVSSGLLTNQKKEAERSRGVELRCISAKYRELYMLELFYIRYGVVGIGRDFQGPTASPRIDLLDPDPEFEEHDLPSLQTRFPVCFQYILYA